LIAVLRGSYDLCEQDVLRNRIWHWYRPRGEASLEEVSEFFIRRQLAVLGLPPELADGDRSAIPVAARRTAATSRGKHGNRRSTT
jgi:hypothetical protein